ncbi:MAG: chloride channel protein [Leptospiraceae bacterium]|nr:chloride channel protein [Leptospiraceae bacterium]
MFKPLSSILQIRSARSIYLYSVIIGGISALLAVVFSYGLAYAEYFCFENLIGMGRIHPTGEIAIHGEAHSQPARYLILILPAIGGLLVGVILQFIYGDANGAGTDSMVHAFHHKEGHIQARGAIYKSLATILTLSTGGSGGREGPTAYIGAGIGSRLARLVKAGPRARRTLLLAGVAGALGAIFRAPFGGAVTAVEIIYREDFESDALIPCIMSSVSGYLVFSLLAGQATLFTVTDIESGGYSDLLLYTILGLLCYGVGLIYVKFYHETTRFFDRLRIPRMFKPAIGGLVVGILGYYWPEVLGSGMGTLQNIFSGNHIVNAGYSNQALVGIFLGIAAVKIVATAFTIGSGGSGGLFAPTLFIGGMLGAALVSLAHVFVPGWNLPLVPFMLVGMGAFFAGVARAPVAALIMVGDMIGSYKLLPPLMIVSMIALVLSHRHNWSLYVTQVKNRFQSPAHFWDMELDVLNRVYIKDQFPRLNRLAVIKATETLEKLQTFARKKYIDEIIVLDAEGAYSGLISLKKPLHARNRQAWKGRSQSREWPRKAKKRKAVLVSEFTDKNIPAVSQSASLSEALQIMTEYKISKIAVVSDDRIKFLGYIRYQHIIEAYQKLTRLGPLNRDQLTRIRDTEPGPDVH